MDWREFEADRCPASGHGSEAHCPAEQARVSTEALQTQVSDGTLIRFDPSAPILHPDCDGVAVRLAADHDWRCTMPPRVHQRLVEESTEGLRGGWIDRDMLTCPNVAVHPFSAESDRSRSGCDHDSTDGLQGLV
jgi:hypothetical protein